MYELRIENEKKEVLNLSQNELNYQVLAVEGLNPPTAEIFTTTYATQAGGRYKASKMQMRNIVIKVKLNGDVERNRLHIYRICSSGKWCKIYYSNSRRKVYIEGYVESVEGTMFTNKEIFQISIVCPDPYFKDLETLVSDISKILATFSFPFAMGSTGAIYPTSTATDIALPVSTLEYDRRVSVYNNSEAITGCKITITANGDNIWNPIIYSPYNTDFFKVMCLIHTGDVIEIDTRKGHKSVKKIANGVTTNMINAIATGSTWVQLGIGDNVFQYYADTFPEMLFVKFEIIPIYEGV